MNKRRKEPGGPNLHKPEGPSHPIRELQITKGRHKEYHHVGRVNRSRYEWDEGNYEDEETWALCFTIGFAERKYPKDSIYLTTSKNMMDHRNPNCGYQIIFKLFKYSGARGQQKCKSYSSTSPAQHGLG
jgi:hypothetical protein